MVSFMCLECGGGVETPDEVTDGDVHECRDCGAEHQVMCDCETVRTWCW